MIVSWYVAMYIAFKGLKRGLPRTAQLTLGFIGKVVAIVKLVNRQTCQMINPHSQGVGTLEKSCIIYTCKDVFSFQTNHTPQVQK